MNTTTRGRLRCVGKHQAFMRKTCRRIRAYPRNPPQVSFTKPDVIVHVAAIPEPYHHPNHVVFQNNIMATFNVLEAAVRCGVKRLVNISSETVPGASELCVACRFIADSPTCWRDCP